MKTSQDTTVRVSPQNTGEVHFAINHTTTYLRTKVYIYTFVLFIFTFVPSSNLLILVTLILIETFVIYEGIYEGS